jgi:hypothetical protein
MFKRNKFKQQNGNLTLYPDYGNLKGFMIIGIVGILFCYALYSVNATHHNIGATRMYYICSGTALLILAGFATAYKKVTINNQSQKLIVSHFGIKLKEISFADILNVEMRSGSLPEAFYVVLKKNPIGTSIRLSPTYNQLQQTAKTEFCYQILPLIRTYLIEHLSNDLEVKAVKIKHFKQREPQLYRYVSVQKIVLALIQLAFSTFFFTLMANFLLEEFAFKEIAIGLIFAIFGLFYLLLALLNAKVLYVDTRSKIIAETFFGISVVQFPFYVIEKMLIRDTQINGVPIYTSLIICTKDGEHPISKSLSTQHLADVDRELKALLTGNVTD